MPEGNAALVAATLGTVGAVAMSGTGAFGRAVGQAGKEGHVGGNGPLVGDEGSGHWISVEGIRRAIWSRDGRGEPTLLVEAIRRRLGLDHLGWIIGRLYGPRAMGRHEIASLAPVVVETCRQGDAVARTILEEAATLLAAQVVAAIHRVQAQGDGWEGAVPFGCSGGVLLGSPELREMVVRSVASQVPALAAREPQLPPVGGVALQALRHAGVAVDDTLVGALAASLPPVAGAATVAQTADSRTE